MTTLAALTRHLKHYKKSMFYLHFINIIWKSKQLSVS